MKKSFIMFLISTGILLPAIIIFNLAGGMAGLSEIMGGAYFEVGMGYIYKKVTLEEAEKEVPFTISSPRYLPSGMLPYETAILTRPEPNSIAAFFTPEFPGAKPGPFEGLAIIESLKTLEDPSFKKEAETIVIDTIRVDMFSFAPQEGLGASFKKGDTNIEISWFGKGENKEELIKVAKSIILN